jgi:hypothetical protein
VKKRAGFNLGLIRLFFLEFRPDDGFLVNEDDGGMNGVGEGEDEDEGEGEGDEGEGNEVEEEVVGKEGEEEEKEEEGRCHVAASASMAVTLTGPILSFSALSCNKFNGKVMNIEKKREMRDDENGMKEFRVIYDSSRIICKLHT